MHRVTDLDFTGLEDFRSDSTMAAHRVVAPGSEVFFHPAAGSTDAGGLGMNFGFPIGETQRLSFGFMGESTKISEGYYAAQEISEFIEKNGDSSSNFKVNFSWSRSTLNRGVFADRGNSQSLSFELAVPGSDLQFFRLVYNGERYFPLTSTFTLRLRGELGYGDGYGSTIGLPFYEHFYAGGFGSIRGFENSTLGPRSTPPLDSDGKPVYFRDRDGEPFGGNLLIETSAELIFPPVSYTHLTLPTKA